MKQSKSAQVIFLSPVAVGHCRLGLSESLSSLHYLLSLRWDHNASVALPMALYRYVYDYDYDNHCHEITPHVALLNPFLLLLCKHGQCHHAMSVCLFVTFMYSVKTNKHIFHFFTIFHHTILFSIPVNQWLLQYAINNWQSFVQLCITVMVHVCLWHRSPHVSEYAKEKRTEQNLFERSGKSEVEVTNNRSCARGIVLLKLTTDRHEASSCSLSATARLLVYSLLISDIYK